MSDVVLIVGKSKTERHAHTQVLAARSEYFRIMFTTDMKEAHPPHRVDLPEDDEASFSCFLEYIYTCKPDLRSLTDDEKLALLVLGDKYLVPPLVAAHGAHFKRLITVENALHYLKLSMFYNFEELIEKAAQIIEGAGCCLIKRGEFLDLCPDAVVYLTKRKTFDVGECFLFQRLMKWLEANPKSGREEDILSHVRLHLMPPIMLQKVREAGVYTDSQILAAILKRGLDEKFSKFRGRLLSRKQGQSSQNARQLMRKFDAIQSGIEMPSQFAECGLCRKRKSSVVDLQGSKTWAFEG